MQVGFDVSGDVNCRVRLVVYLELMSVRKGRPSWLFIEVGFGILRLHYCGVCVAAADWQALARSIQPKDWRVRGIG